MTTTQEQLEGLGTYKFGWADSDVAGASARRGLSEEVVRDISARKNEPQWMLDLRLKGLKSYGRKPLPTWGADLSEIDFDNIKYFVRSTEKQAASWDELPADIKNTYDRLGIPEAEKQRLIAGVAAQYESEVVYHKIREDLEEKGVIFLDTDTALREQPDLFREYFGTVIPPGDNKFAALNTAVWSGGSFIYVPKNVKVEIPLQAYLRIDTENMAKPLIAIDPQPRDLAEIFDDALRRRLENLGELAVHDGPGRMPAERLDAPLPEVEFLIRQSDMPSERLDRAPRLRAIVNVETNFLQNVDYETCFSAALCARRRARRSRKPVA